MPAPDSREPADRALPGTSRRELGFLCLTAAAGAVGVGMALGGVAAATFATGIVVAFVPLLGSPLKRMERTLSEVAGSEAQLQRERESAHAVQETLQAEVDTLQATCDELRAEAGRSERSARSRGDFLANMSHEIRTPMSGILGMVELLLQSDLSVEQRDISKTIHSSAEQLLTILNDILDFSKMEAGKLELEHREFNLRERVQGAVEILASQAREKGLELTCLVMPDVPEHVVGDETRLLQLLMNLIGNAVKFTGAGGVSVQVTRLPGPAETARLEFRVKDTGPGIARDKLKLLFRPFTQLEASTSREFGGTGLGLAISSQLAEMMNGQLGVESEEGLGSAFLFEAEFALSPRAQEMPLELEQLDRLRGRRALLVDANEEARRVMAIYAGSLGIEAVEAAEHQEALEKLRRAQSEGRPFSYVFIDRNLPQLDGREFASLIKSEVALREVDLILLNTIGRMEKPASLVRAGLDAWVTKPISQEKLRTVLLHLLEADEDMEQGLQPSESAPKPERDIPRLKVLLAEDNVVNQKVASLLLRKLGCEVHLATNGKEAVQLVEREPFALVFMDCQMPVMSGFEATAEIRNLDDSARACVPIIAMTANAMRGDREQCLHAGMNDYLSKPVQLELLDKILDRWARRDRKREVSPTMTHHESSERDAVLDQDVILSLRALGDGDEDDLFAELVQIFLEDTPTRIRELNEAFESNDLGALEAAAHALKSSCANLGAHTLSEVFRDLESAGRERDQERAGGLIGRTGAEYERVEEALRREIG